jgi:hypothetical protein
MSQESPLEYTIYDKYDDISDNIIYNLKNLKNKNAYDKIVKKYSGIFKGNESLEKLDLETLKHNLLVFFEANEGDNIEELQELDADLDKIVSSHSVYGKKTKKSKAKKSKKSKKSKAKKSKKGGRRMRMRK